MNEELKESQKQIVSQVIEIIAHLCAQESVLFELLNREGVPNEHARKVIAERKQSYLSHFLRKLEKSNPHLAGELDNRRLEDVSIDEAWVPLFSTPPPEPPSK